MRSSSRLSLNIPDGTDLESSFPAVSAQQMRVLDGSMLMSQDTISNRPAPGLAGRTFYATDTKQWYLDDGTSWNVWPVGARGAVVNAGPGTRTNTAYGALNDAADQVTGIVLPTNGLMAVWYQATWQESVAGAGRAAIFIGSNQLVTAGNYTNAAATNSGTAGTNRPLFSWPGGLVSYNTAGWAADVATGQAIGGASAGVPFSFETAGVVEATASSPTTHGGPCYIFLSAGTYTVSVQFKASSGTVSASSRKLWVKAEPFG